MEKYIFLVHYQNGNHTVVTRLADGAMKYFFQAGKNNVYGITKFMNSMTDELIDSYFPRTDKKGKMIGGVDNWLYLGHNPGRIEAERLAKGIIDQTTASS